METQHIRQRDLIYAFLQEMGGRAGSDVLCRQFFADRDPKDASRILSRLLSQDLRFSAEGNDWKILAESPHLTSLGGEKYCVFDLETTGGVPPLHRIIEIGAVRIEKGVITETFESLIYPERPVPDYVERLTGITTASLKNAPLSQDVLKSFLEFSKGCIYVAHNASFDINFLDFEIRRVLNESIQAKVLCTLKLVKDLLLDSKSHKLEDLALYFNIPLKRRHRALDDAQATALILLKMFERMAPSGIRYLEQMRKYEVPLRTNHLSVSLMGPEQLNELPVSCGIVVFLDRYSRPFYAIALKSVQKDMKQIFYQTQPSAELKGVLKKAKTYKVEMSGSYFMARLTALKFRVPVKPKFNAPVYCFKLLASAPGKIFVCNRRINDKAQYFGPFANRGDLQSKLGNFCKQLPWSLAEFPPKSGVIAVYEYLGGNLPRFSRTLAACAEDVNLILLSKEGSILLILEGQVRLSLDRNTDQEILRRSIIEMLNKDYLREPFNEAEMWMILAWFFQEAKQNTGDTAILIDRQNPEPALQDLFKNLG